MRGSMEKSSYPGENTVKISRSAIVEENVQFIGHIKVGSKAYISRNCIIVISDN